MVSSDMGHPEIEEGRTADNVEPIQRPGGVASSGAGGVAISGAGGVVGPGWTQRQERGHVDSCSSPRCQGSKASRPLRGAPEIKCVRSSAGHPQPQAKPRRTQPTAFIAKPECPSPSGFVPLASLFARFHFASHFAF